MDDWKSDAVDLTPDSDGGVLKRVLRAGYLDVKPANGNKVFVHYVGRLEDGTVFDSSRDSGREFSFNVDRKTVVDGFDWGVKSMTLGELASFRIEAKYGYGEKGSPPKIAPNATLIFDIELLSLEGEDISPNRDKSITKSIQVAGKDYESPTDDSSAKIHVTAIADQKTLFDRDFDVVVGECTEVGLPAGIDKALLRLRKGEKSYIQMGRRHNYDAAVGCPMLNIPAGCQPSFLVTLVSFEKSVELWSLKPEESLVECGKLKERADNFLKEAKYRLAVDKYTKIAEQFTSQMGTEEKALTAWADLKKSVNLNLALAYLKIKEAHKVVEHCNEVLNGDPANVKALYRRAQARQIMKDYAEAQNDYAAVLNIEPDNKAALLNQAECQKLAFKEKAREKSLYSAMFSKVGC